MRDYNQLTLLTACLSSLKIEKEKVISRWYVKKRQINVVLVATFLMAVRMCLAILYTFIVWNIIFILQMWQVYLVLIVLTFEIHLYVFT